METVLLGIILTSVLGLVHYFGESINENIMDPVPSIASFSAGISVAYVFLLLLPEMGNATQIIGRYIYLFGLIGFSALHILEKIIYLHEKSYDALKRDFKELHSGILFFYHLGLGVILYIILSNSVPAGVLFFIPLIFHTVISSLSLKEIHEDILDNILIKIAVSVSGVLGVVLAHLSGLPLSIFDSFAGIVTGMFMHVVITDSLEMEKMGNPWSFVSGVLIYTFLTLIIWTLL